MTLRPTLFGACAACLVVTIAGAAQASAQGKLGAFEADATAPASPERAYQEPSDGGLAEFWAQVFAQALQYTLWDGGACSWERVTDGAASGAEPAPRRLGDPLIPFARFDLAYQYVESDVEALDVRAEAGFGPFGAHLDYTRYWEQAPADRLDLVRVLGLFRMSFGSTVEADLGCGVLTLNGDQPDSRFLLSLPVLIHPSPYWGVEFRPAWAARVSDYDLAALLTWRCASLKLGYRWVDSPNESLDGPYAGFSVRW